MATLIQNSSFRRIGLLASAAATVVVAACGGNRDRGPVGNEFLNSGLPDVVLTEAEPIDTPTERGFSFSSTTPNGAIESIDVVARAEVPGGIANQVVLRANGVADGPSPSAPLPLIERYGGRTTMVANGDIDGITTQDDTNTVFDCQATSFFPGTIVDGPGAIFDQGTSTASPSSTQSGTPLKVVAPAIEVSAGDRGCEIKPSATLPFGLT